MIQDIHNLDLPPLAASSSAARGLVAAAARQIACMTDVEIDDLCVAVGEAFANIVRHGTPDAHDPVRLRVEHNGERLIVHLTYRSDPFNTAPAPPPPEEMAGGGYGLFIMRTLADVVEFEFAEGTTHLCLEKRCNPLVAPHLSGAGAWSASPGVLHSPCAR
jgi:anti-sigma regulatory factor (Ser/Thr protein kinase)